ncbi:hypothetical protein F4823DRAFT_250452 [Ustulina deusta]|nr:hypothetical protein F4823DRAFT_250452 [Ustulina deusta]
MPSRKKRSCNRTRATRWSAEEEEHLLAWLDHCIRYDIDFDTTVASRMRIVTQRAPTQRQCTWKVIWFRKTYCPNTSPQIIWLKGSSILELEEESRQRIRQLCHELEPPEQSRESSVLSSLGSTPSYPGSDFCVEGDEKDADRSSSDEEPSSAKPEEGSKLAPGTENSQSSARIYPFRSIGVQTSDMFPDSLCPDSSLPGEIDRNARLMAAKEARLTAQQHRICHLENELSIIRKGNDRLLRDVDASNNSAHNLEVLHKLRNDNSALKRQLQDIRASQSNELLVKSDSLGPTISWIRDELDWLEDRLAKTCSALGCSSSTTQPLSEESVQLRRLITRVSGMPIDRFNTYILSTNISDYQLARSLTAALICELSFESSFPDSLGSESLILRGYREQILIKGDYSALESLDLLAHNSLFSDRYFLDEMIPAKSRDLANEIYQLLVEWNYHQGQTQHLGLAASVPKNEFFQPIFARVLAMKAKLVLSKSHYALVFPATGAEFNPETMRRHTWRYDGYNPLDSRAQPDLDESSIQLKEEAERIKLCLFPALYAYQKPPDEGSLPSLKIDTKRHVVNYRNFFVTDGESTMGEPTIISKAIVQL